MDYSWDRTMMTSNTNHSPPHPRLRLQSVSLSLPWSSPFGIRASTSTSTLASPGGFSNGFPDRSLGASSATATATAKAHPKRSRHVILPPFPSTHRGGDQSRGEGMDCSDSDDNYNYNYNYNDMDYRCNAFFPTSKRRRLWTQAVPESIGVSQSNPPSQEPPNFVPWEDHHCRSEARGALSNASDTSIHSTTTTSNRCNSSSGSGSGSSNKTNSAVPWWKKQKPSHRRIVEPEDEPMDGRHNTNNNGGGTRVACHVCCASFVPPPPPMIRSVMPENALLHYFSVQTPTQRCTKACRPRTAAPQLRSQSAASGCPCCDRPTCPDCWNQCGVCSREFCSFCCTVRYPGTTVCPDCC